ncbi:N-acetyltransferase [Thermoanaerobacterium sp. DL9XJH110]|uniref:N-acetyltransferase n=1 Tax=Thermoanaerobacterium sp. DL9XJH110 TaxID=3386643 RepID=UPI003BB48F43
MAVFRKAVINDVETIYSLVNYYAKQGLMLARSRLSIYENLRDFTLAEDKGEIVGCGALHIIWADLAEIRSLAIAPHRVKKGWGKCLVELLVEEARNLGVSRVMALTYQRDFFIKCGFRVVDYNTLPQKAWKDCVNCPKFPNCDEIPVIKDLTTAM